jgi:N-methylhydantoinase B
MTDYDPIVQELIKNSLSSLVDEMAYTVVQTAHSEIVKDVMDFSTACCNREGVLLAQGNTIAMHLGAVPEAMAAIKEAYASDDIRRGDVFVLNDPYEGGMHLPDVFMVKPVFHGPELFGWTVAIGHQTDMGGRIPGSNASDSTEIYQEGLRIPPLKFYDEGTLNVTLERIVEKNVRVPGRVLGDWNAQLAACHIGEAAMLELVERYGIDQLERYFESLLDYSEEVLRKEIVRWADGTYEFTDYIDGDGFDEDPIPIHVAVTVDGDSLTVDYAGTAGQVRGALNSTLSFTKSCTYLSVRSMLTEDIPNNAGFFRPIKVVAPEASIVNVKAPGACAARALTGYRIVDALFGAFAQITPERVPAAGEGGNSVICLSGRRKDESPFIVVDMMCGAWGGRPDQDGIDAITHPAQNLSNTPVELLEAEHPIRVERYCLVTDTCGAGRFRGGMAIEREYRVLADEGALLQLRTDRSQHAPWGLAGGSPGSTSVSVVGDGDAETPLPSKVTMELRTGQTVRHRMAGAGGYGDPLDRSEDEVRKDVLDERISTAYAHDRHGVVITEAMDVDREATARERSERRLKDGR